MAAWRKKAYSLCGFKPGSYNFARGRLYLFADIVAMFRDAAVAGDNDLMSRIIEYVRWANDQDSEELASAVDLAFFLPVFRDATPCKGIQRRVPADLFSAKWRDLMQGPQNE